MNHDNIKDNMYALYEVYSQYKLLYNKGIFIIKGSLIFYLKIL